MLRDLARFYRQRTFLYRSITQSPFSLKGLATGIALSILVGVVAPLGAVFQYFLIGFNPSSPGAIFFFLVLTLVVNVILRIVSKRLELSRADLVLIYCMLLMAVTMPTWGLGFFLLGTIVFPYYYATTENRFAELFHELIPSWMTPQDPEAIRLYYEGLPKGAPIPWGPWIEPLGWWFAFIIALGLCLVCMSAILHRQWSVHERLSYPMVQLPQQMIEEGGEGSRVAPLFRRKLMWFGFAVPFIIFSLDGLHHFFPIVPEFGFFHPAFSWFRGTVSLVFAFSFAWVGFFYLASLELSFSIWFFYVFCKVEEGIFKVLGISSTEKLSSYEYSQPADLTHQAAGATIVLVLFGLWTARVHLKEVFLKAWNPATDIDDSEELLPYRSAVLGFLGSLLFITVWLWRSGVPPVVLPVLVIISLIFFILVARVVATAGVATARSPIVPAYFIISGLGTTILGAKGLIALNFTFIWQGESRTSPMVACSNGLKLAETIRGPKGILFCGFMLALICSLAAATFTSMQLAYEYGAVNLFLLDRAGGHGWPYIGPTILEMPEVDVRGWLFTALGGLAEGFLVWAQHRWFWWPLHPIGFAIGVGWLTGHIWFSCMVAWVIKLVIVHIWGVRMFQMMKPFFLGLILGEVSVSGVWGSIYPFVTDTGKWLTVM